MLQSYSRAARHASTAIRTLAMLGVCSACSSSPSGNGSAIGGSAGTSTTSSAGSSALASFTGGATGGAGGSTLQTGGTRPIAATGGTSSDAGGSASSGGMTSQSTGGTQIGTGGKSTSTGGRSGLGGSAPTGGRTSATGGKTSATGGKTSATGGSTAATGGITSATGGSTAATGGITSAIGGASTGGTSGATTSGIRWVGRVEPIDATSARFAWQGAGLIANVSGSTIAVKLRTEDTNTVYFQPVVDHTAGTRFKVDQGADRTVTIATGLGAGEHLVELYRETEGYYGISTFLGFTSGTVSGAPASNGRLLEVVGDSISAGYGNLGSEPHPNWVASPACHWTAENSSWYATYAAVAGHALGAEVSTIARSGAGMVRDNEDDANNVLPNMYANALGTAETTAWSFTSKASAVVINLGTNDWASGDPGASYETAYVRFIATVRGKYPDAWLFLVIGSMVDEPQLTEIKTRLANVVSKVQSSTGDTKLATFDLGVQDMGSDGSVPTGCDWHPNVADHKRMAGILQSQLTTKLGW